MFKGRGGSQTLPLARALSIHVLHRICVKGIRGGAKSKALADEVLYLLWCPHRSLQPTLSSPLRFDSSLSSVCWKSRLCCSHWAFGVSVCRIVLSLSAWWEKLGKTMSGGSAGPLWCPFHLSSSFSVLAFPDDSDDLCRSPAGVDHLTPSDVKQTIIAVRAHTHEIKEHIYAQECQPSVFCINIV